MYASRSQDYLYEKSAQSIFEVITKPLHECNDERPYYTTQNPDILFSISKNFILLQTNSQYQT